MSDGELEAEHTLLKQMQTHLDAGGDLSPAARIAIMQELGATPTPALGRLMGNPDAIAKQLEMVHRARAVNLGVPDENRGVRKQPAPTGDIVITGGDAREAAAPRVKEIQPKVDSLLAAADQAVRFYADAGDDSKADDISVMRQVLESNRNKILTEEDMREFQVDHKAEIDAIMQHYVQRRVKGEGGGSILS